MSISGKEGGGGEQGINFSLLIWNQISQVLGWNICAAKGLNGSDNLGSQCFGIVIGVFALSSPEK